MNGLIMTGKVEATMRGQRLLVAALVTLAEKGTLGDEDLLFLVALTERGLLLDEDVTLIKEYGLAEHVRAQLCRRAGWGGFENGGMFDTGEPPPSWRDMAEN